MKQKKYWIRTKYDPSLRKSEGNRYEVVSIGGVVRTFQHPKNGIAKYHAHNFVQHLNQTNGK